MLGNDLVINEDSCNLGCEYCLTGQSNLKKSHRQQLIFQPPTHDVYSPDSPLGARLNAIIDRTKRGFGAPLLKLTGGEIFLVQGITDFIGSCAHEFEVIVVQTNGLPLTEERVRSISEIPNLVLQISLDSSDFFGNSYRINSEALHRKLIKKVEMAISNGLAVELYCVLNDRSVERIGQFVEWCSSFESNLPMLFPFPVRGPIRGQFQVQDEQIELVEDLLRLQRLYPEVLPPQAYIHRLVEFFHVGERKWRCHLPRMVLSTFSDGTTTPCPNIWFNDMGSLLSEEWEAIVARFPSSPFHKLLLGNRPRIGACKGCFTPWDTLSMFMDDEISIDELCASPTYKSPVIRNYLVRMKEEKSWN